MCNEHPAMSDDQIVTDHIVIIIRVCIHITPQRADGVDTVPVIKSVCSADVDHIAAAGSRHGVQNARTVTFPAGR